MNRISPAAIAASFLAHPECRPIRSRFRHISGGGMVGCCGLARAAIDLNVYIYGCVSGSERYDDGFVYGWDGLQPWPDRGEDFEAGYADGKLAWELTQAVLKGKPPKGGSTNG